MKLYKYSKFIKESTIQSKEDIDSICQKYGIGNYTINDDGSIDVDGDVDLYLSGLTEMPIKFRSVTGYFYCGSFHCGSNRLTSLHGSPKSVGGSFHCGENQLTSLEGSPESIGGDFICLENLLTSLEGSPRYVGGEFDCSDNLLTSLIGSPESVVGSFFCDNNRLTSLDGIPKSIDTFISTQDNNLRDVRGIKDGWRGRFNIRGNPVYQIFKLFPDNRQDEVIEYLNEYDVIRDSKVIVLQALEQVFVEMGLKIPEIENINSYEIIF